MSDPHPQHQPQHPEEQARADHAAQQQPDSAAAPSSAGPGDSDDESSTPPTPAFIASPTTRDKWLFVYLFADMMLSLAMIPLRVWLLNNPLPYALLVGGYTSAIIGGAQSTVGGTAAWVIVVCALVGGLRSIPLWWMIGRWWGREYLAMVVEQSPRMRTWLDRLGRLSPPLLLGAIFISYIPFMPIRLIANLLATIRGVSFRMILAVNAAGVLVRNSIFAYIGIRYGEQVIGVVDQINRYALWITLALVVFAVISARRSKSRPV
ncbi:DedA family protein [Corynebacterium sp. TAE3-ERU30]|uniref:DedA family protein n=1 Tax=Corynebacterium sp. TAE3-ERU30 TaxID=2849496 RepID=UPI001C452948|nr:DedA family protein [Corynebacterium sp. TAE3-ERU30]MBV7282117.1 DedA family protein [Corynebacterium sp. TAE3-ERU30]